MKRILTILILTTTTIFALTASSNKEISDNGMQEKEMIKVTWNEADALDYQKPSKEVLKNRLTTLQFNVTQKNDTERAFNNIYWDNHEDGIYVDIVSGEALFSSLDKFESGTGWPSFTRAIHQENIILESDKSFGITRVEVRSLNADSHLGHLFTDGPQPTGERYCINSASLRFIPIEDMEDEGYTKYLSLFK